MSQNTSPEIAAENLEKKKFVFFKDEILNILNSKDMSESTRSTYAKRLVRVCKILKTFLLQKHIIPLFRLLSKIIYLILF